MKRQGLYQCKSCKWYFIRSGRTWYGTLWPADHGKLVEGYLTSIGSNKQLAWQYADCSHQLQRITR